MLPIDIKIRLKEWADTDPKDRDYCQGLSLLVQASGNRTLVYTIRKPEEKKDFIDYNLSKYIRFAISDDERQQVKQMSQEVKKIVQENFSLTEEKENAQHKGRRDDHDSLPDEIKALYVENLDILRQMRDLHLKLRTMTAAYKNGTLKTKCIDAERYPFLVEIINLDKRMHANWKTYDTYVPGEHPDADNAEDEDE